MGPYLLQAQIAACHARARTASGTDWRQITFWYDLLAQVAPSPIVQLNRAVSGGSQPRPARRPRVARHHRRRSQSRRDHLYSAVRADLLDQLGRTQEARAEFERAASLTTNQTEQNLLLERAARLTDS